MVNVSVSISITYIGLVPLCLLTKVACSLCNMADVGQNCNVTRKTTTTSRKKGARESPRRPTDSDVIVVSRPRDRRRHHLNTLNYTSKHTMHVGGMFCRAVDATNI